MADTAAFANTNDLYQFYKDAKATPTDFYGTPGGPAVPATPGGLRPVGPVPAKAFPVTSYQAPPTVVNTPLAAPANVLPTGTVPPDLPRSAGPPALRSPAGGLRAAVAPAPSSTSLVTTAAERGWSGGPAAAPRTVTPISSAVPQIGYTPSVSTAAPRARVAGPGIEGMGDFATATNAELQVGKNVGLRSIGGAIGRGAVGLARMATSAPAVALGVLQPIASAQSAATANSNGPVLGLRRGAPLFGGPGPGRSMSTNAISYTNPFSGAPVDVTQSSSQSVVPLPSGAPAARPVAPATDWASSDARNRMIAYTAGTDGTAAPATDTPPPLAYGGNTGYVGVGGAAPALQTIGTPGGIRGTENGVVTGQAANSKNLIDTIIAGHTDYGTDAAYNDQVARAARVNAASGLGGNGFTTVDNYTGNLHAGSGQAALFGLRWGAAQAQQHNAVLQQGIDNGVKQQEIGLKGAEHELGLRKLAAETPYYQAHAEEVKAFGAERLVKAEKERFAMSPEGRRQALLEKGKEETQALETAANKASADVLAKGGTKEAAETAYASTKANAKGLGVVPATPATPATSSLFGLRTKKGTPGNPAITAPISAIQERNTALAATTDADKIAAINARFTALYGGAK